MAMFDYDDNGMLRLSEHNVDLMTAVMEADSNYRRVEINVLPGTSKCFFNQYGVSNNFDEVNDQVDSLDRENSTHLSVSGRTKGSNRGRELMANYISCISGLSKRICNGDPTLVDEIADAIKGRKNYSFASKFCTYASRFVFQADKYCIYDQVIADLLPYYVEHYADVSDKLIGQKNSKVPDLIRHNGYGWYRNLINEVRKGAAKAENGYMISKEDFDHLLWYYYKGEK